MRSAGGLAEVVFSSINGDGNNNRGGNVGGMGRGERCLLQEMSHAVGLGGERAVGFDSREERAAGAVF